MKSTTCFFAAFALVIAAGWTWLRHEDRKPETHSAPARSLPSIAARGASSGETPSWINDNESRTGARAIDLLGKMLVETIPPETLSQIVGSREEMLRLMTMPGVTAEERESIRLAFDRFLARSHLIQLDGNLTDDEREQRLAALDASRQEWVKAHLGDEILDSWNRQTGIDRDAAATASAKDAVKRLDDAVGLNDSQHLELMKSLEEKARLSGPGLGQMQVTPRVSMEISGIHPDLNEDIHEILTEDQKRDLQISMEAAAKTQEANAQAMEELMQALIPSLLELSGSDFGEE